MKAKKKKLGILAGLLAGCCFLTSCTSLYDVAPKAFAEWDGNYIYCANMRSKTTGEGEEYLIETLTKDGTDYTFNYARDYAYVGDDIYMCLDMKTTTQVENRYDYTTCFAVYNVQDKTSEVVLWGEDDLVIEYIYYMTTEYAVLRVHGGKYDSMKVLHSVCQQLCTTQQWPQDWKRSVFIPIPKKGNAKECSNYCTIALISHASKVMLKILQASAIREP